MKTSSVGLATAACVLLAGFAGGASAQSSVTIYGIVDNRVVKMNDAPTTVNSAGTRDQWNLRNGAAGRLGFAAPKTWVEACQPCSIWSIASTPTTEHH